MAIPPAAILIGAIVITLVISIVFINYLKPTASTPSTTIKGPFALSGRKTAMSAADFLTTTDSTRFLKENGVTFQAFIYLDNVTKAQTYTSCGNSPNKPSCDSGLYATCPCTAPRNCDNCAHEGYMRLLDLYGVYTLEILNMPDASRQGAVSCQLAVKTKSVSSSGAEETNVETIALPALPLQKWVMVTIAREGRRTDVYYNGGMVSSSMTENPVMATAYSPTYVEVGDSGLSGTISLLRFYWSRQSTGQVSATYSGSVDTRGAPIDLATKANAYSATIEKPDSNTLLGRLLPITGGGFSMPAVTLPAFVASSGGSTAGSASSAPSISSLYTLESPYA